MAVPSNLLGLLLFVVLLWPGFLYSSIRGRRLPERQTSVLRETVSIVVVSLGALAAVLALFGVARVIAPADTPAVRALIFTPRAYLERSYVSTAWWGVGMLAVAVLGSAGLAMLMSSTWIARRPVIGKLIAPHPSTMSAWWMAFSTHDQDEVEIHVGCTLDDGTYISGRLYSYSQTAADVADRELLLTTPISIRAKGQDDAVPSEAGLVAVSARRLVMMNVSYVQRQPIQAVPPAGPVTPNPPPASAGPPGV